MKTLAVLCALPLAGLASAQSLYSSATVGSTVSTTTDAEVANAGTVGTMTASAAAKSDYGCFGYRISDIRGPMRPLVRHLDGAWTFEPDAPAPGSPGRGS